MSVDAVLVSFTLDGHFETYETSGTLFNPNLVLLTGTSFIPLVQEQKWISLFLDSCFSKLQPNPLLQKFYFRVHIENKNQRTSSEGFAFLEASAVAAWKCPLVSQAAKTLLSGWTVGHVSTPEDTSGGGVDLSRELMSVFVVLKCRNRQEETKLSEEDIRLLTDASQRLRTADRGQEVEVVSTPFGHRHFVNSLTRGVVSSTLGGEKCIILTDARTVSGCEGGPIFISKKSRKDTEKGELLGMVTCPLTWRRGEWVGLTVGISLLPVLKKLLRPEEICTTPDSTSSDSLPFKFIDESVVLVRSTDSWGTGVVLRGASGVVITCSHVVKDDEVVSVYQMGKQWPGNVVFRSKSDLAFDLAVLRVKKARGFPKGVGFSRKPAKLGETVIAAGFPFFSEQDTSCLQPSIVTGCVSRVNPYMIQTTCCIQSGFSGGPLFRDGELLGIVISNAIGSGALFPHINFIAPSTVFKEPIFKYVKTNDIRHLKELESPKPEVQAIWKLSNSKL